ncbi:cache domain-containing protein [Campylobacter sp. 9BO]|uniref:cache domain-containing protein n=1 Tax=Campylobacter sp. 9BO TaxID=3424759 RepID=UPI003D359920
MSQNILGAFHVWFGERISMLERASKYIEYSNMLENEENINNFLNVFAANSPEFDLIQLQSENEDIWAGGHKIPRGNSTTIREGLLWYAETKMLKKPTVNFMPKHYVLGQETLNFCVPNFYNGEFKAVLCGIVKINAIFEKMKNFKIPSNSYIFIAKNDGKILTPFSNEKLKTQIQTKLNDMFLKDSVKNELNIGSNFIAISEIEYLSWFIGAGTDNKQEANALLGDMAKSAFSLLGGFLLLTLFINLLHNIAYKKINKRKEEYELILAHKARMSEIGELISGINHQFIQPVNSLKLINSTLISLKNDNKLSYEKLQAMLENQNRSISLLSDTIEIFIKQVKI